MILVIVIIAVSLLVVYFRLINRYWTKRGVVQEPPLPFIGNLKDVLLKRKNAGQLFTDIYRKHSRSHDAVGVYEFMTPNLLVINPALIKQVLVNDFSSFHDNAFTCSPDLDPHLYNDPFFLRGDEWKPKRAAFASIFTQNKVKDIFPYLKQLLPQLDSYIDQHHSKDLEAKDLTSLAMMNFVSNSVFGIQENCFDNPDANFRKMGEVFVKESLQSFWITIFITYFPRVRDLIRYRVMPEKVINYIENMIQQVVEYRKKNNIKRKDAIDSMMNRSGDDMFDMVTLAVAIFLDGFETSSTVASFLLYELAMNPKIQENLYEEIRIASNDSCDISFENLINLPYMELIFKETMRKYAVGHFLKKSCTKRCSLNIDGRNVEIEPDTPIIIPFYAVHNDPQHYPNPEKFDPERFAGEKASHSDTFFPFGDGPRICPGMRLANAQMKLFIRNIVLKFKILSTETTPTKINFSKDAMLLISEKPLNLRFERR